MRISSPDIDEEPDHSQPLQTMDKNFQFFLENTSDYIYFKDVQHRFTFASRVFAELTSHNTWQELIGKTDFDVFPQEHAALYFQKERPVITDGKEIIGLEEPYYNLNGELCWVSSSKRPIYNEHGDIVGLFGISRDITRIKQLEMQLSHQANYDALTGLANRASFQQQSEKYIELAKRNRSRLAFFFLDLDDFKVINDQHGHEAGDVVLQEVGGRLKSCFRKSDIVGRLGGDEFVALAITDSSSNQIRTMADHVLDRLKAPIAFQQDVLQVSGSVGIACFPLSGQTFTHLIRRADHALYRAKQRGKQRCYMDMDVLET